MAGKVLVAVPTFEGHVLSECAEGVANLNFGGLDHSFYFPKGYGVAECRNLIAERALDDGCEWVLMVDSDILVHPDALVTLMGHGKGCVLGFYATKGRTDGTLSLFRNGFKDRYMAYEVRELRQSGKSLIKVSGGGFGCALVRTDVFKSLKRPWFDWVERPNGTSLSEDLYFCNSLNQSGIGVYADTRVGCGHIFPQVSYSM